MEYKTSEKIRAYMREYRKTPQYQESHGRYLLSSEKQRREYGRQYRNDHKKELHPRWLKRYGITEDQYADILASQGGKCAICGGDNLDAAGNVVHMCVDHDHETGRVRGLLCRACNIAAGSLKDNADRALHLAEYLKRIV